MRVRARCGDKAVGTGQRMLSVLDLFDYKMKNVVTMRLPKEVIKELEDIAKEEHLDSLSLIRKMLLEEVEGVSAKESSREIYEGGDKHRRGDC